MCKEILALRALYIYLLVMWHKIKWIFTIENIKKIFFQRFDVQNNKKNDKLLRKLGMKRMCAHKSSIDIQYTTYKKKESNS